MVSLLSKMLLPAIIAPQASLFSFSVLYQIANLLPNVHVQGPAMLYLA